ncbi:MAG: hypothetical protein KDK78_12055, partial [Chlamydiia bacterium]|nr:hypothetical protein [Chlamydiia bacterium]
LNILIEASGYSTAYKREFSPNELILPGAVLVVCGLEAFRQLRDAADYHSAWWKGNHQIPGGEWEFDGKSPDGWRVKESGQRSKVIQGSPLVNLGWSVLKAGLWSVVGATLVYGMRLRLVEVATPETAS